MDGERSRRGVGIEDPLDYGRFVDELVVVLVRSSNWWRYVLRLIKSIS